MMRERLESNRKERRKKNLNSEPARIAFNGCIPFDAPDAASFLIIVISIPSLIKVISVFQLLLCDTSSTNGNLPQDVRLLYLCVQYASRQKEEEQVTKGMISLGQNCWTFFSSGVLVLCNDDGEWR